MSNTNSKLKREEHASFEALAGKLVDEFYQKQNAGLLTNLSKRNYEELSASKEKVMDSLREEMSEYVDAEGKEMTDEDKDIVLELVRKEMWGYGLIDDLIHNPDISDIKTYSAANIRVKKKGKRYASGITFESNKAYQVFVTRLLERNKINLGTANAIQTFTDSTQDEFILRITAISGLLTDSGLPCVAFRKIPKDKYTLKTLENAGMFRHVNPLKDFDQDELPEMKHKSLDHGLLSEQNSQMEQLIYEMIGSKGILFTGKGASGKTTLMNADRKSTRLNSRH